MPALSRAKRGGAILSVGASDTPDSRGPVSSLRVTVPQHSSLNLSSYSTIPTAVSHHHHLSSTTSPRIPMARPKKSESVLNDTGGQLMSSADIIWMRDNVSTPCILLLRSALLMCDAICVLLLNGLSHIYLLHCTASSLQHPFVSCHIQSTIGGAIP